MVKAPKTPESRKSEGVLQDSITKTRGTGGFIANKSERGQGLKFKVDTYRTVMQFQPGTRIKYNPNPKRPGSISFARYATYENSKTIGEALKSGAKMADFLWEFERKMYQVLGETRSEAQEVAAIGQEAYDKCKQLLSSFNGPNGLALNICNPNAEQELEREDAWRSKRLSRCEALALELRLPVESSAEVEASTESADIRLQRRVADAISAKKLQDAVRFSKKITDADVGEVLELWGYCQNVGRVNVMKEGVKYVYSDTIGCIKQRTGTVNATPPTRRYPNFPRLLCQWLKDQECIPDEFVCTAINLNANYAGKRHRDGNNEGPSVIKAFGSFTGGRLMYWPKDTLKPRCDVEILDKKDSVTYDISNAATLFDGNRGHEVEDFIGDRYSVVFFTASAYIRAQASEVDFLKSCGFPWPTPESLAHLKKITECV